MTWLLNLCGVNDDGLSATNDTNEHKSSIFFLFVNIRAICGQDRSKMTNVIHKELSYKM